MQIQTHTGRSRHTETYTKSDIHKERQRERQTERQVDRYVGRNILIEADRHTETQAGRQKRRTHLTS